MEKTLHDGNIKDLCLFYIVFLWLPHIPLSLALTAWAILTDAHVCVTHKPVFPEERDHVFSCLCLCSVHSACLVSACHLKERGIRQAMENRPRCTRIVIGMVLHGLPQYQALHRNSNADEIHPSPKWCGFGAIRAYLVPLTKQMRDPEKQLLAEGDWLTNVICCYVCFLSTGSVLMKSISPAFC